MNILLTGSTGFVGKYLTSNFTLYKRVVRIADEETDSSVFKIDSINGNTNWSGAFDNVHVIIHLAGLAHTKKSLLSDYCEINVQGTLNLAKQAIQAGVKRFVFVSSIGVNGISTTQVPFSPCGEVHPHNAYTQSKYDAECGLTQLAEDTDLEVVIVRPTLVYGANAPGNFGLLTKLVSMLPVLPFGMTTNKRDFIAVQNLADLLITCATHPKAAGHTFLASDMETVSIKQFTNAIADGLGKKLFQLPIPVSLIRLAGKLMGKTTMVEQLVGNLQVDSSNILEVLDWTPPLTMKQAMATLRN